MPGFDNKTIVMNEEETILSAQTTKMQKLSQYIWEF
jgi:hypothetical protein